MEQKDVWKRHTEKISIADIERAYHNATSFQTELAHLINQLCQQYHYQNTIEIGCEMGITSLLLDDQLNKTLLDYNDDILTKVKEAAQRLHKKAHFICEDMFCMSLPPASYDVIFNSGVIEHYTFEERVQLLTSYAALLKPKGKMVLAIPNHYCAPYRGAYVLRKEWLNSKRWPWPAEFKIYDLKEELDHASLELVERSTLDFNSAFTFWKYSIVRKLLRVSDHFFHYEGYLTVLIIQKKSASAHLEISQV
jgi:2-polyprenyl-3-methyl-5-hydroxy-6-metoxy-1,4-benzoquinol methylase